MWECPDFFAVRGKHCLLYSTKGSVIWTTGDYNAASHTYVARRDGVLDHGAFYAPKSFLAPDGRRILWGWITETRPEAQFSRAGWAGLMSLPRVLTIGAVGQLEINPAVEVEKLRGTEEHVTLKPGETCIQSLDTLRRELHVPMDLFKPGILTVRLVANGHEAWLLTIDVAGNAVHCGKVGFALPGQPWPNPVLRLFLDGSVIESFIGGREALTSRVYGLKPGKTELQVTLTGGKSVEMQQWPLEAISPDRLTT
jgi:beta-fructofuranosidase